MDLHHSLARLVGHHRLWPRTVRLRLTLLYGGLFLVSGAGLLAITNVLVRHNTSAADLKGLGTASIAVTKAPTKGTPSLPRLGLVAPQANGSIASAGRAAAAAHTAVLHQLAIQSGIALCVMAALSVALGWIVAGKVLRPIDTMTSTVHRITATNLHERLALDGPDDELKKLGDTFDELLTRLEKSFDAQRRFVANASHELRTPLTRQRTVAQVALADPDATIQSLRSSHQQVLASGAQQERMIEALLTLTRVQAGLDRQEGFDLATVTHQILESHRGEAKRRGIAVHADLSPTPMQGDSGLIERLLTNLIDNALGHNIPDGQVEVITASHLGHAVLFIANTGPIVPEAAVDRLLQPFQRLGPDRTSHDEGLGLGLSIVVAIVESHDAAIALRPRPGGGLGVEVRFPEAAERIERGEPNHEGPSSKISSTARRRAALDKPRSG